MSFSPLQSDIALYMEKWNSLLVTVLSSDLPTMVWYSRKDKFYSAQLEPEDLKSYDTKFKKLSQQCEFKTSLNEALRIHLYVGYEAC